MTLLTTESDWKVVDPPQILLRDCNSLQHNWQEGLWKIKSFQAIHWVQTIQLPGYIQCSGKNIAITVKMIWVWFLVQPLTFHMIFGKLLSTQFP